MAVYNFVILFGLFPDFYDCCFHLEVRETVEPLKKKLKETEMEREKLRKQLSEMGKREKEERRKMEEEWERRMQEVKSKGEEAVRRLKQEKEEIKRGGSFFKRCM